VKKENFIPDNRIKAIYLCGQFETNCTFSIVNGVVQACSIYLILLCLKAAY